MPISDVIADMLTRIRNANDAKHESVDIPASNLKKSIAQILLEEGYIKNYQIINKELIEAIVDAGEWLREGLSEREAMGEVWSRPNPCEECPDKVGCSITCRRKHTFDKVVYGGLLCGAVVAAGEKTEGSEEVKNKVHFKVRL